MNTHLIPQYLKRNGSAYDQLAEIAAKCISCSNYYECRHVSPNIVKADAQMKCMGSTFRDQPIPQPGFIGENYSGFLIVASNPGMGDRSTVAHDDEIYGLYKKYAERPSIEAFSELNSSLTNKLPLITKGTNLLSYRMLTIAGLHPSEIAYMNVVKCKSDPGNPDPLLAVGKDAAQTCALHFLKKQTDLLRPIAVIFGWKAVEGALTRLGIEFLGIPSGMRASYKGARNLTEYEKVADVRKVVAAYRVLRSKT
jgi:hypothetical protein